VKQTQAIKDHYSIVYCQSTSTVRRRRDKKPKSWPEATAAAARGEQPKLMKRNKPELI